MLTLQPFKDRGQGPVDYLRQADYYSEGLRIEGFAFGSLCEKFGLKVDAPVSDEQFEALASNLHPVTKVQLTERMAAGRRAGCDAVYSAPKSVSIQACVGGDERLVEAHECGVKAALAVQERFACRQVGQGISKRYVPTRRVVGARFRHRESRSLDPQLHDHCFHFNLTEGEDGKMAAFETVEIYARARFLTEVYRNTLAVEVQKLGYEIRRTKNGFELVGVSSALIDRFSKRSKERDRAIKEREAEVGRPLSANEVSILVRDSRAKKLTELSPNEVRARQLAELSAEELGDLTRLRESANGPRVPTPVKLAEAVERAKEHVFERQTVVPEHELMAEVIRAGYGEHTLHEIQSAVAHGRNGLWVVDGRVSTLEAIEHERALIGSINAGMAREGPLGRMPAAIALSDEQRGAVQKVLENRDTIQVFRGKAGTGKTTSLFQILEGCAEAGRGVACFAPSSKAVGVLRQDGAEQDTIGFGSAASALKASNTVQRLLVDPELQESVAGKVIVIDEYGLLSSRDLERLVDLVVKQKSRLLLVGDSSQHTSVQSGSAARIIERETRISISEIREIRRQSPNQGYLRAAQALAAGDLKKGLSVLNEIGAVVEIAAEEKRREAMVGEWFDAGHGRNKGKTSLMVAPTWNEIDSLNRVARERLRSEGNLKGEDSEFRSLWRLDWTRAQSKDSRSYQPGQVLVAVKRAKSFEKGDELLVVRQDAERIIVHDRVGRELSLSPRQSGGAWAVCENRPIPLAAGDQIRLRTVGQVRTKDGKTRRVANGSVFKIAGVDVDGRVRLADGSRLLSREIVHGYACTSHSSQGVTVDSVFMTDPLSKEGLYVSATRGRQTIRIFTENKTVLLEAARLRTEDRTSATEFARRAGLAVGGVNRVERQETLLSFKRLMADGVKRGSDFALLCLRILNPWWAARRTRGVQLGLSRGPRHMKAEAS